MGNFMRAVALAIVLLTIVVGVVWLQQPEPFAKFAMQSLERLRSSLSQAPPTTGGSDPSPPTIGPDGLPLPPPAKQSTTSEASGSREFQLYMRITQYGLTRLGFYRGEITGTCDTVIAEAYKAYFMSRNEAEYRAKAAAEFAKEKECKWAIFSAMSVAHELGPEVGQYFGLPVLTLEHADRIRRTCNVHQYDLSQQIDVPLVILKAFWLANVDWFSSGKAGGVMPKREIYCIAARMQ